MGKARSVYLERSTIAAASWLCLGPLLLLNQQSLGLATGASNSSHRVIVPPFRARPWFSVHSTTHAESSASLEQESVENEGDLSVGRVGNITGRSVVGKSTVQLLSLNSRRSTWDPSSCQFIGLGTGQQGKRTTKLLATFPPPRTSPCHSNECR